jgi:hypothetical protein
MNAVGKWRVRVYRHRVERWLKRVLIWPGCHHGNAVEHALLLFQTFKERKRECI